jgi:arylsulfatase A-like enzyme
MIEALDRSVGKIIAAVKRLGLDDNTFVFFTSDNGGYRDYADRFGGEISSNGPLRGQKGDVFEGGHRVPAIAWWPGRIRAGAVTDEIAMTFDLMPTYLDIVESPPPEKHGRPPTDGLSLAPLLFAGQVLPPRTLFWRKGAEWAVRQGPWKLVGDAGRTMLFNLRDDIAEVNDLARQHPHRTQQLHAAYQRWQRDVADVLR